MKKSYVIKNTENNKYFTDNYNGFWSLDIRDARRYSIIEALERDMSIISEGDSDTFENVKTVVLETIYDFN
jgi:hypothetical protein